jgi:hypothetical protein
MRSDQYLHPELGFLAPTARLRRELRLGVLSMLFGVGIGVVAVTALSLGSRDQDGSAHSAGTGGTVGTALGAANGSGSDRRGGAASTDPNETGTQRANAIRANQLDPMAGGEGNSADDVKEASQGKPGLSGAKAAAVGAGRRALPPTHGSPAIARLPLGRSDAADTIKSQVSGDLTPTAPLAPGASESIPLPREKPRKAVGRNALRQAELNGHEDSGNIWTGRGDGRQTTRPRAPSHDSSRSLRGFWAWSW